MTSLRNTSMLVWPSTILFCSGRLIYVMARPLPATHWVFLPAIDLVHPRPIRPCDSLTHDTPWIVKGSAQVHPLPRQPVPQGRGLPDDRGLGLAPPSMALQSNHHQASRNSCFAAFLASLYSVGGPWLSHARQALLDPSSWPLTCSNPVAFCNCHSPLASQITRCVPSLLISGLFFIGIAPLVEHWPTHLILAIAWKHRHQLIASAVRRLGPVMRILSRKERAEVFMAIECYEICHCHLPMLGPFSMRPECGRIVAQRSHFREAHGPESTLTCTHSNSPSPTTLVERSKAIASAFCLSFSSRLYPRAFLPASLGSILWQ